MKQNLKNDLVALIKLVKRNITIFLKDKVNVFFSLLSPLTVVVLYLLFLCDVQVSGIESSIPEGVAIAKGTIKAFVDGWMVAGTLAVACLTVSLGANSVMVRDKNQGVYNDFIASPVKRSIVNASYFIYNFIVTIIICFIVMVLCLIYLAITGGFMMSFVDVLLIIAILICSTLSATLLTTFVLGFLSSEPAFSAVVGIFSAVSGFLTGSYMPLSMFPSAMQSICAFLPATHSGGLFRNVIMKGSLKKLTETLPIEVVNEIEKSFSLDINFFGTSLGMGYMWLALGISIIIFLTLNLLFKKQHNAKTTKIKLSKNKN